MLAPLEIAIPVDYPILSAPMFPNDYTELRLLSKDHSVCPALAASIV
jgi:hypothetical protein